jgi:Rad3-related DNA helicase
MMLLLVLPYCKEAFERCNKVLIMSATISDPDQFCKNVGLKREEVEIIAAPSDFPKENRPIYVCNTAKLDWKSLQLEDIQIKLICLRIPIIMQQT